MCGAIAVGPGARRVGKQMADRGRESIQKPYYVRILQVNVTIDEENY